MLLEETKTGFLLSSDYAEGRISKRICKQESKHHFIIPESAAWDLGLEMGCS